MSKSKKTYKKLKNKLTKVVTEAIEVYKEIGELPVKHTWVIDESNSITFEGVRYTFFVDYDELYYDEYITCNISPFFKDYMGFDIYDTDEYVENIVNPILKYCKSYCKKAMATRKKILNVLCEIEDQDEDWVIDMFHRKEFNVDEIVESAFEDVEIVEEILYSTDKKIWVEADSLEAFIEDEGLVNGTKFWIKRDGVVKRYVVEIEEIVNYRIIPKKACLG